MNEIYQLTGIYHETQEGSLCAQHALNNLLQRELFSAISLADIARELDEQERSVMGHRMGESQNMDDSGFFSIQVLQRALNVFDLELIPYGSQHPIAQQARVDPLSTTAYICNLREHWLTIRKFGTQFFDLNSISTVPKLISDTYLALYLTQLKQSGYSIFIVNGVLPTCSADEKLSIHPIDPTYYRSLIDRADGNRQDKTNTKKSKNSPTSNSSFDEQEIQRAIKASVELDNSQDKALQQVLAQSLQDAKNDPNFISHNEEDPETINQRLLEEAIAASLKPDTPTTTTEPTAEEIRQRRLQFFENKEKSKSEEKPSESSQ